MGAVSPCGIYYIMVTDNSQSTTRNTALIAMSGGVDSAVAALTSLREGLDCVGAIMILHSFIKSETEAARLAAEKLGIRFHVLDFSDQFTNLVISRFVSAYRCGRTPNPCIDCNRQIKFGLLLEKAQELFDADLVTGHYARIEKDVNGRYLLNKAADTLKDQSYVLYTLKQEQLAHTRFPLGALTKQHVRDVARDAGLQNATKRESQDICFVPDGDYADFIAEFTGTAPRAGRFVDVDGNDLGPNKGIDRYTVGQRRGIGLSMPYPAYVLEVRPADSSVVVGKNEMLYSKTLYASDINFIPFDKLDSPIKARVKVRYKAEEQPATVTQTDVDTIRVDFDKPQRAITKGQAAVIYDGDVCLGGGTII